MFTDKTIHMIGIGGISMSGIAQILKSQGTKVTGYDAFDSQIISTLKENNILVSNKTNLKSIENADIIVYTAAIKETNEELMHARKLKKEVYERSTFLGLLMKEYKNVLCISGTHGKSTTSGMVATIFEKCGLNPTIQIGAMLPLIGGNYKVGSNEFFIAEACEYVDSFLEFFPTSAIILNVDEDHLDYFKDLNHIIYSFKRFANKIPDNGYLVVNNDDESAVIATDKKDKITFGIKNDSNYMAKNIVFNKQGHPVYDLYVNNNFIKKVSLKVSGMHNVLNSLAAVALCHQYISSLNSIINALETYTGVGRRFEYLGKFNSAFVYDDYAHHPNEIASTLASVKATKHNKNWAIFQPHTYSRTKDHLEEFADVLSKFDNIILTKIYAAREENIYGVKEEDLVNLIKDKNKNIYYFENMLDAENFVRKSAKENDLIITIGAGDIYKLAKNLIS